MAENKSEIDHKDQAKILCNMLCNCLHHILFTDEDVKREFITFSEQRIEAAEGLKDNKYYSLIGSVLSDVKERIK